MNACLDWDKNLNMEIHTQKVMNQYNVGIMTHFILPPQYDAATFFETAN